ncbi:MAG: hypothetical protein K1X74_17835 [Pirellulales bacterium]|nr:hypothetical protein [Pirellulales bacterium]
MATAVARAGDCVEFGCTQRRDAWWTGPLVTGLSLGAFIVYGTIRAFMNGYYQLGVPGSHPESAHILSPLYSPLLALPAWVPAWFSPALLILPFPGGFRLTCYYYRKAYYRAFFLDPVACGVAEKPGKRYRGETFVLLFQNLHRFFLYAALAFLVILTADFVYGLIWPVLGADGKPTGSHTFGVSVGTLVLLLNVTCLSLYTFSCHSLRHLVGGKIDCWSCVTMGQARYNAWKGLSKLNEHHMLWAWVSLYVVSLTDVYVFLCASDVIRDIRLI